MASCDVEADAAERGMGRRHTAAPPRTHRPSDRILDTAARTYRPGAGVLPRPSAPPTVFTPTGVVVIGIGLCLPLTLFAIAAYLVLL